MSLCFNGCLFLQENGLGKILYFCIISVYAYDNPCLHSACPGLFNMSLARDDFNGLQNISAAYCLFLAVAYFQDTIHIHSRTMECVK